MSLSNDFDRELIGLDTKKAANVQFPIKEQTRLDELLNIEQTQERAIAVVRNKGTSAVR